MPFPMRHRNARMWPALAALVTLAAAWTALPGAARAQPAQGGLACGKPLSGPILEKWTDAGGAGGPLGCPTAGEMASSTSPQGAGAREAPFAAGTIVWHASGPHAGQTFVVSGCIYRLYFQYGGPSGWLGLPVSDAVNTPDGQRQAFEGGAMYYRRATDECSAEHASATESSAAAPAAPGAEKAPAQTSPLDQFYHEARGDYFAAASAASAARAQGAGYRRLRTEGYVLTLPFPGDEALKAYWNETLGAHETVATAEGERDALAAGFVFDGAQGFIFTDPAPGTMPLKLYRNAASGREITTATAEGEADAAQHGYAFVRIEGFVLAAPP